MYEVLHGADLQTQYRVGYRKAGPDKTYTLIAGYPLKFPVFSLSDRKFSVPIYMICDYYIHKTDFANLSTFKKSLEIFMANIFYL